MIFFLIDSLFCLDTNAAKAEDEQNYLSTEQDHFTRNILDVQKYILITCIQGAFTSCHFFLFAVNSQFKCKQICYIIHGSVFA